MKDGTACTNGQFAEISSQLIHALPRAIEGKDAKKVLSKIQGQGNVLSRSLGDLFESMIEGKRFTPPAFPVWRAVLLQPRLRDLVRYELEDAGLWNWSYSGQEIFHHPSFSQTEPKWVVLAKCRIGDLGCEVLEHDARARRVNGARVHQRLQELGEYCPVNLIPQLALDLAREKGWHRHQLRFYMEPVDHDLRGSNYPLRYWIHNESLTSEPSLRLSGSAATEDMSEDDEIVFVPRCIK